MADEDQSDPGKLLDEVADSEGNQRTYLVLPDGRKLPLPYHFRKDEFALPGNTLILEEGRIFALYDESTRTGAIYDGVATLPHWRLVQPVTREMFFDHVVPNYVRALRLCGHLPFAP